MQNIRAEDLVVIDIETASVSPDFEQLDKRWQELWQEKTSRSIPEGMTPSDFFPMRAGVMAEFSKIVCISIGYYIQSSPLKLRVKSFYGDDEQNILTAFTEAVSKMESFNKSWCFAGHNIKEFDIPFICRRLLINNMTIPPYLDFQNMKPWETNMVDTFQYWRFGDYKNYTSLKLLAAAMGLPSPKDDIDGSMVGPLFHTGTPEERAINIKRIAAYCQKDVVTTANIILRFKHMDPMTDDDVEVAD
ncbi:MAG: ribonuclease H-like domain-containing protein [Ferruginibacter sp.]